MKLTCSMNYFQKMQFSDLHRKICQYLTFHYKPKGAFVFLEGQAPDNFYIIVRGVVAVFMSIPPREAQQKASALSNIFVKAIPELMSSLQEIAIRLRRREFTIRSLCLIRFFQKTVLKVCVSLKYLRLTKSAIEQRRLSLQSRSPMRRKPTNNKFAYTIQKTVSLGGLFEEKIYQQIESTFNCYNKGEIKLSDMPHSFRMFKGNVLNLELSAIYREGYSFGELVDRKSRDASVVTLEDTVFAVLDQRGYESSVVESEQKRVKKNTTFIRNVLFPPEQLISSEKLSRISYYFQKVTLTSPNHVFLQSSKMHSVHVLYSGEVEVSKLLKMDPPSPQEIKIHIIGSQEIIDDIDYFENQSAHSFSAKVISNKCKVLQIKRENFDRLLRENKDVLEFLKQKWLTKKSFFRDRIDTFLDVRSRFLVKKKKEQLICAMLISSIQVSEHQLHAKKDDFGSMIDQLPQNKASQIKLIVVKNRELQRKQGADQIDSRALFLLTKKIGNFQLALRNFKSGKHLNFDIDQDEIKMRNLVNLRLGRKYSQVAPATDRHGNSHRVSFYGESSEFVRSRRIIKSLEKRYETENLTEPKINNIHLSQLRMDSHRNLKFKQFRDSKFQQHLKDEQALSPQHQQSLSSSHLSQIGHKVSFHQRKYAA